MNDETTNLDQADAEELLTYTVSDEALEAAAGGEKGRASICFGACLLSQ